MKHEYSVTMTETNDRGHTVKTKITTQDESVIKKILGLDPKPKKDAMDAEFKETKKKKSVKKQLPTPKKEQPKKVETKKENKTLKAYHYEWSKKDKEFYPSIIIYSCNKKDADKLAELYAKATNAKLTYFKTTSISAAKAKPPKELNINNYFELQKAAILKK